MSVRRIKRVLKSGKKHERWIVDIGFRHPDGSLERIRQVPRVQTRVGAERLERELLTGLEQTKQAPDAHQPKEVASKPTNTAKQSPCLRDFWPEFFATYVAVNNKPSEQHAKRSIYEIHLQPAFGHLRLDAIGSREIEKFKADKLLHGDRTYSAKSINN